MNIKEFFQKNKILSISAIIALIIVLILALGGLNSQKKNLKDSPIQELTLTMFYSKSTRDAEKKESDVFKLNDPIQANINYKNAFEKTNITFEITDATGKVIQNNTFDIEGTDSIFITVGGLVDTGNYKARIKYNDKDIASTGFRINN
jgi:hypothetical protein